MKDTVMITRADADKVARIIENGYRFILTTHVNPDGDGLGSELALAEYLRQRGKTFRILNSSPVPENYRFLDPNGAIEVFSNENHVEYITSADVLLIVDISDWQRLRELGEKVRNLPLKKVCIDHHLADGPFADLDLIHPEASSTGEMIFDLFQHLGVTMNQKMRDALYTAILTDTGSFRFSNTTARVHQIAAVLLEQGVDAHAIYRLVYENQSMSRVRLMAKVLAKLKLEYDGQLAHMYITQKMLRETGATLKDSEGLADFPRTIAGVEVGVLLMELEDGRIKISLRSKGKIPINSLANEFGGGGHAFAAGASTKGTLQEVSRLVIRKAAPLFKD